MSKVYIHFQDSEAVGVSSNSEIALNFILNGTNRDVKQFELETKIRKNGRLQNKAGRKRKIVVPEIETTIKKSKKGKK